MRDGFIKCAAAGIHIKVADPEYNTEQIKKKLDECVKNQSNVIVFPELCLTGYTCNDLFLQGTLLQEARQQLQVITEYTKGIEALVFIGLPFEMAGKLYNVAAVIQSGRL